MSDEPKKKQEAVAAPLTVNDLVGALQAMMKANSPTAGLLTGMSDTRLARVRGELDVPLVYRLIRCRSIDTGATFTAIVQQHPMHKHGVHARMVNYQHSPDTYVPESAGGRMPDGQHVWRDAKVQGALSDETPGHMLTPQFKQWRYEEFWKKDLTRFRNGFPLRPEHCIDPADLEKVPWETAAMPDEQSAA